VLSPEIFLNAPVESSPVPIKVKSSPLAIVMPPINSKAAPLATVVFPVVLPMQYYVKLLTNLLQ
jgi:hypothetical protein